MRLKQRARVLAAGVALFATTLALLPGVAQARIGGGMLLVARRRWWWLNP
jgi:hypothetical protein